MWISNESFFMCCDWQHRLSFLIVVAQAYDGVSHLSLNNDVPFQSKYSVYTKFSITNFKTLFNIYIYNGLYAQRRHFRWNDPCRGIFLMLKISIFFVFSAHFPSMNLDATYCLHCELTFHFHDDFVTSRKQRSEVN